MATNTVDLADELSKLAERLEEAANDLQRRRPGDMPARGKLANEYAILAGDRLLRAARHKAIRDRQLLAHLDVDHPDEGQKRNLAFLHAIQRWLPTVSHDHRPDTHNVARRYADDLRALAAAINPTEPKAGYLEMEVDQGRRCVTRNGEIADFSKHPRAWGVFCCLLSRKGEYASRQDILREVWPDDVVGEENVDVQVSAVRLALSPLGVVPENAKRFGWRLSEKKSRK